MAVDPMTARYAGERSLLAESVPRLVRAVRGEWPMGTGCHRLPDRRRLTLLCVPSHAKAGPAAEAPVVFTASGAGVMIMKVEV